MPAKTITRRRLSVYFANTAMAPFVLEPKDKLTRVGKTLVLKRENGDTIVIEMAHVAYRVLTTFTEVVKAKPNRVVLDSELGEEDRTMDLL